MPEPPDFEQIARSMITTIVTDDASHRLAIEGALADFAEQLRLVWNARGAADITQIEDARGFLVRSNADALQSKIRSLDR
jgi:hypothetical protein